jgi:hypothetical protein
MPCHRSFIRWRSSDRTFPLITAAVVEKKEARLIILGSFAAPWHPGTLNFLPCLFYIYTLLAIAIIYILPARHPG